ncbi:hypothetical protein UFOVP1665_15 [uncultured Caudovirales phage]|uniref:Uncharacterized protein n=1 Tax=uncultured Caudovirales phage TaxID=2100421 RepID=A0A6J5T6I1_9CAUD|nr:hypothetical protein UFOVP1665_15 [uncultured Caudovirales phage]
MTKFTPVWRIRIDGGVYTSTTMAQMSITSGRTDIYSQPVASYAHFQIIDLDSAAFPINVNDTVTVEIQDSTATFIPLWGGFVTDLSVEVVSSGSAGITTAAVITALGSLARLPKALTLGVLAIDLEGVQIETILTDLLINNWSEVAPTLTWANYGPTTTWANAENVGLGEIDAGQYELDGRSSSETDMYSLCAALATSGFGYLYENSSGQICYADTIHRETYLGAHGYTVLSALDAYGSGIRTATRTGDVRNEISVVWKSGTETATDVTSISSFGRLAQTVQTTLNHAVDATDQADRYLNLRAYPRAQFDSITFPLSNPDITDGDRDALLNVFMGQPIQIDDLPLNINSGQFQGFVEGWTFSSSYNSLDLTLMMSPIEFSLIALQWAQVSAAENWNTLSPTLTWDTALGVIA